MQGTVLSLRDAVMIKAEVPVLRELILQCVHFFFFNRKETWGGWTANIDTHARKEPRMNIAVAVSVYLCPIMKVL